MEINTQNIYYNIHFSNIKKKQRNYIFIGHAPMSENEIFRCLFNTDKL